MEFRIKNVLKNIKFIKRKGLPRHRAVLSLRIVRVDEAPITNL